MIAALILAASLQTSIKIEIDLSGLWAAHWRSTHKGVNVRCGIKTVGYRWSERRAGDVIPYMGRNYVVGTDGELELIAGREIPRGHLSMPDQFGFRNVED